MTELCGNGLRHAGCDDSSGVSEVTELCGNAEDRARKPQSGSQVSEVTELCGNTSGLFHHFQFKKMFQK